MKWAKQSVECRLPTKPLQVDIFQLSQFFRQSSSAVRKAVAEAYFCGASSLAFNQQFVKQLWDLSLMA